MHNSSASNIDSTLDTSTMTKPSTSNIAHANAGITGENSQVKTEDTPTPSTSKENTSFPSTSKEDVSTFNESIDMPDLSRTETESSNEQEMLRRRRLQKFSPPPATE